MRIISRTLCVTLCLQVVAEDADSQQNGAILYSIISGDPNNQFYMDRLSGVIKVNKQLDRETVRTQPTHREDTNTFNHFCIFTYVTSQSQLNVALYKYDFKRPVFVMTRAEDVCYYIYIIIKSTDQPQNENHIV